MKRYKLLFLFLPVLLFYGKSDFSPTKIICKESHNCPQVSTPFAPEILQQPFDFYAKGVQSYVFLGRDGKTILKVFKHHHFGLPTYLLKKLPKTGQMIAKREARLTSILTSAHLAWSTLPQECALIGIHFEKTPKKYPEVTLYDLKKRCTKIDLNLCEFLLQEKGESSEQYLERKFKEGEGQIALASLFTFMEDLSRRGIKNRDPKILENFGFVAGRPVLLDVGSLRKRSQSNHPNPHAKLLGKMQVQIERWLRKKHPAQLSPCHETMEKILNEARA